MVQLSHNDILHKGISQSVSQSMKISIMLQRGVQSIWNVYFNKKLSSIQTGHKQLIYEHNHRKIAWNHQVQRAVRGIPSYTGLKTVVGKFIHKTVFLIQPKVTHTTSQQSTNSQNTPNTPLFPRSSISPAVRMRSDTCTLLGAARHLK